MGMDDPGESSPSQLCRTYREVLIMRYPGLVNVYITNWKDPPCYSWENQLFRLGHGFNSELQQITRG